MNNPVGWFEIYVQDMGRARTFYEKTFGLALSKLDGTEHEMWAFPMKNEGGGASGALVRIGGVSSGGGGTLVYFSCADCAIEAARATAAGGRIDEAKKSIGPYGFISLVVDTEGNLIGLHSMT